MSFKYSILAQSGPVSETSITRYGEAPAGNAGNIGNDPVSGRCVVIMPPPCEGGILSRLKRVFSAISNWFKRLFCFDKALNQREVRHEPNRSASTNVCGSKSASATVQNDPAKIKTDISAARSNNTAAQKLELKVSAMELNAMNFFLAMKRQNEEREARIAANNKNGFLGKLKNMVQEGVY